MWEGWLEFVPIDGGLGDVLVSSVESRQPEREHLAYWATGLTPVYSGGRSSPRPQSDDRERARLETPSFSGAGTSAHHRNDRGASTARRQCSTHSKLARGISTFFDRSSPR